MPTGEQAGEDASPGAITGAGRVGKRQTWLRWAIAAAIAVALAVAVASVATFAARGGGSGPASAVSVPSPTAPARATPSAAVTATVAATAGVPSVGLVTASAPTPSGGAVATATAAPEPEPTTVPDSTGLPLTDAEIPPLAAPPAPAAAGGRDKLRQPFSSTSPWNMPIGSGAQYAPAGFGYPTGGATSLDTDYFFVATASDRRWTIKDDTAHYAGPRCFEPNADTFGVSTYLPDGALVDDIDSSFQPNNAAAVLQPDGRTLISFTAIARCQRGGPVYGAAAYEALESIYGDGITGGHTGSGLSSIGGSVRFGELTADGPITHALKVNIYCPKYCSPANGAEGGPGYRWPAVASDRFCGGVACGYGGVVPGVMMGSLLAMAPGLAESELNITLSGCDASGGLQTALGKKLFHAMQDYGAYVADDNPSWDVYSLDAEAGVGAEVKQLTGVDLNNASPTSTGLEHDFWCDWNRLFQHLSVVTNNGAGNVGGGGTPRAPLAPPIGN